MNIGTGRKCPFFFRTVFAGSAADPGLFFRRDKYDIIYSEIFEM